MPSEEGLPAPTMPSQPNAKGITTARSRSARQHSKAEARGHHHFQHLDEEVVVLQDRRVEQG
eukprot:6622799-Alexandrium_andersonii.AAC.1